MAEGHGGPLKDILEEDKMERIIPESTWLLRAVEQKNTRLTLDLAHSKQLPLLQDDLSKVMALVLPNETNPIIWN